MLRLEALRWGDDLELSSGPNAVTGAPVGGGGSIRVREDDAVTEPEETGQGRRDSREGQRAQTSRPPLEAGKGKQMDRPPEPPGEMRPGQKLDFRTSDLQTASEKFVSLEATKFTEACYSGKRNLTYGTKLPWPMAAPIAPRPLCLSSPAPSAGPLPRPWWLQASRLC